MDRASQPFRSARVALPTTLAEVEPPILRTRLRPAAEYYVGLFGFVCCGVAVIVAASFIALQLG